MKLEKLTPEQEKFLIEYQDNIIENFFNNKKRIIQSDKKITKLVKDLYNFCELNEPEVIIVESPLAAQIAANMLTIKSKVESEVWSKVRSKVESEVRSKVRSKVELEVRSEVRSEVWSKVRSKVESEVWSKVRSKVESEVESEVWSEVESEVWSEVESKVWSKVESEVRSEVKFTYYSFSYYGNTSDFGWCSFYNFFKEIGVKLNNSFFQNFHDLVFSGIYDMIQLDGLAIVCKLPSFISRDVTGELHNKSGPAISWKDGYSQYYIHGVSIPEEWITKGMILDHINNEDNQERKRVAIDLYGYGKYIQDSGAKIIDKFSTYRLYEFPGEMKILECVDSTPENFDEEDDESSAVQRFDDFRKGEVAIPGAKYKRYFLRVPPHLRRAKEAVAWTYYMSEDEYEKSLEELIET